MKEIKILDHCDLCEDIECWDAPEGRYGVIKGIGTGRSDIRIKDCPIRKMHLESDEVEDYWNKTLLGS